MSVLSRLKMPRPGQLLALCALALLLGLLVFAILPNGLELLQMMAWKLWQISCLIALGLAVDLIIFWYARPGAFKANADRTIWMFCMFRRAIVIGSVTIAGGVVL